MNKVLFLLAFVSILCSVRGNNDSFACTKVVNVEPMVEVEQSPKKAASTNKQLPPKSKLELAFPVLRKKRFSHSQILQMSL